MLSLKGSYDHLVHLLKLMHATQKGFNYLGDKCVPLNQWPHALEGTLNSFATDLHTWDTHNIYTFIHNSFTPPPNNQLQKCASGLKLNSTY